MNASTGQRLLEIRSYRLRPGTREAFHALVAGTVMPMLRRWPMDVVRHGPSPHDDTSYLLMRAYADAAVREHEQAAFYGSADWREGPREAVLAMIEEYLSVVVPLDAAVVDGLRQE